jgi:hypothetical protein
LLPSKLEADGRPAEAMKVRMSPSKSSPKATKCTVPPSMTVYDPSALMVGQQLGSPTDVTSAVTVVETPSSSVTVSDTR